MTDQIAFESRVANCRKLINLVRQSQNAGALPEVRYLARRLRMPQKEVIDLADDAGLNVNVGWWVNGDYWEEERIGDYTIEDLNGYD